MTRDILKLNSSFRIEPIPSDEVRRPLAQYPAARSPPSHRISAAMGYGQLPPVELSGSLGLTVFFGSDGDDLRGLAGFG